LTLAGANTYTNTTLVSGGKLIVDGSLAGSLITVTNGAVLGGSGSVQAVTMLSGSTLAAGNGPGTMTFNDALTLASGSTNVMEIAGGSSFDILMGAGTNTLTADGLFVFDFTGNTTVSNGSTFAVLQNWAGGTYTGATVAAVGLDAGLSIDASTLASNGSFTVVSSSSSHTLTGSAGAHGAVTPASTNVASGGSADFVITADSNYRIASLTTNGTDVAGMSFDNSSTAASFTWSNVLADGTLAATFTAQTATDPAGTPYEWLAQYGLTNFDADAVADQDLDGLLAWQEYIAGTDPTNNASCLRVTENPRNTISWSAVSGRVYSVYWTTNLLSGFQSLDTNIVWPQSSYTNATAVPHANYQIKVRLQ
jgi:autotransporter-associated beta strand protein